MLKGSWEEDEDILSIGNGYIYIYIYEDKEIHRRLNKK